MQVFLRAENIAVAVTSVYFSVTELYNVGRPDLCSSTCVIGVIKWSMMKFVGILHAWERTEMHAGFGRKT